MRRAIPIDALGLTSIEGLGPKHAKALYDALGVRSLADLEAACRDGRIRDVPHFGAKSEEKILRGLELRKQASGRHPIGEVWPLAREIEARLAKLAGTRRVSIAGSLRRR